MKSKNQQGKSMKVVRGLLFTGKFANKEVEIDFQHAPWKLLIGGKEIKTCTNVWIKMSKERAQPTVTLQFEND